MGQQRRTPAPRLLLAPPRFLPCGQYHAPVQRVLTHELMDDPAVDREALKGALGYIRAVNRLLGGQSALLMHLQRWSKAWSPGQTVTLLDIATGSADLPVAALKWASAAGFNLRITAVDVHDTTLALAQEHVGREGFSGQIDLAKLDARKLTDRYPPGSFDYVHAGLFLHHLPEIEILTVLSIMERLSKRALIWNDLVRSRPGYAFITLATLGQPEIIRHDARVSVLAGFTRREAMDLARRADVSNPRYRWNLFTHRFTLTGEKPGLFPPPLKPPVRGS